MNELRQQSKKKNKSKEESMAPTEDRRPARLRPRVAGKNSVVLERLCAPTARTRPAMRKNPKKHI